jgi:hypothetical protein
LVISSISALQPVELDDFLLEAVRYKRLGQEPIDSRLGSLDYLVPPRVCRQHQNGQIHVLVGAPQSSYQLQDVDLANREVRNEDVYGKFGQVCACRLTVLGEHPFHLPVLHQSQERLPDLRIALQH